MEHTILDRSEVYRCLNTKGTLKYWCIEILEDTESNIYTRQEYWQQKNDGTDSSHQYSVPKLIKPKNLGKKNETSLLEQARSEVGSSIQKQLDKGYFLEGEKIVQLLKPMLALKYTEHSKSVVWPSYIQPKYDGIRCLHKGNQFWTRLGKEINSSITSHIKVDTGNYIFDGELMLPYPYSFQESIRAIKKYRDDITPQLLYYVYDCYIPDNPNAPFKERWELLNFLLAYQELQSVQLIETKLVSNEEEFITQHTANVESGFEGSMLRSVEGPYAVGHRSKSLLKYKNLEDEDFLIVGVTEGEANFDGCAIFVCKTLNGNTFNVVPKGSIDYKKELYQDKDALIGKYLKVGFFGKTEDGVPKFGVGIGVKDELEG
jgi:ATP-dependent DNA ligase